jgi:hypothetical protein
MNDNFKSPYVRESDLTAAEIITGLHDGSLMIFGRDANGERFYKRKLPMIFGEPTPVRWAGGLPNSVEMIDAEDDDD